MTEESTEIQTSSLKKNSSSRSLILNSLSNKSKHRAAEQKHIESDSEPTFIQRCKNLNLRTEKILTEIINGAVEDFEQYQYDISTIKNEICKLSEQPYLSEEDKALWTNLLQKLEVTHLCLHIEKRSNPEFNEEICNPAFTALFFATAQQQRNLKQLINIWKTQKELSAEWVLFIAAIMRRTEIGVDALQKKANFQRVCKWIHTNCDSEKHLVMAFNFWNDTLKELQTIKQAYDKISTPFNPQQKQLTQKQTDELKNEFMIFDTPSTPITEECKSESLKTSSFSADITLNQTSMLEESQYSSASHWYPKSSSNSNTSTTPKKLNLEKCDDNDEASILNYDFI